MERLSETGNSAIQAAPDGAPNRIENVADGIKDTDAVNVSQIQRSYKSYVALVTQSTTGAPTAVVLENDLGAITFSYNNAGNYRVLSTGLFTSQKTALFISQDRGQTSGVFYLYWLDDSTLALQTLETSSDTLQNDALLDDAIEIRVYN